MKDNTINFYPDLTHYLLQTVTKSGHKLDTLVESDQHTYLLHCLSLGRTSKDAYPSTSLHQGQGALQRRREARAIDEDVDPVHGARLGVRERTQADQLLG